MDDINRRKFLCYTSMFALTSAMPNIIVSSASAPVVASSPVHWKSTNFLSSLDMKGLHAEFKRIEHERNWPWREMTAS